MRLLLTSVFSLALASSAFAGMGATVEWGPTKKCFDSKSPPISLSGVPAGTAKLDIRMMDLDAPSYDHGGGKVDYKGQPQLGYGAFRYTGPCPPSGRHSYRFTVKALDAKGMTLDTAKATKNFPQ